MLNGFGLLNLFCQSLVYQFFPGLSPHSGVLPHPGVQVLYWLPLAGHSEGRGDALMREGWFAWKFELPLGRRGLSFSLVPSPSSQFQVGAEDQGGP